MSKEIVAMLRPIYEIKHHYRACEGGKYYVHLRCEDKDDLRFLVDITDASNNQLMIQVDDQGFYYTLIVHHNEDILRHYLEGRGCV